MASGNAENKSAFENGMFLKVDNVEPGTKHDFMIPVDLISKIEFDRTVD